MAKVNSIIVDSINYYINNRQTPSWRVIQEIPIKSVIYLTNPEVWKNVFGDVAKVKLLNDSLVISVPVKDGSFINFPLYQMSDLEEEDMVAITSIRAIYLESKMGEYMVKYDGDLVNQ